jgi:hypothetical protein
MRPPRESSDPLSYLTIEVCWWLIHEDESLRSSVVPVLELDTRSLIDKKKEQGYTYIYFYTNEKKKDQRCGKDNGKED